MMDFSTAVNTIPLESCNSEHQRIGWHRNDFDSCPLCGVMSDLRRVSAKLEEAEQKIALDALHLPGDN